MKSYVITVVCVILIGTVFEILLPDGNFRKYLNPVLGMIMVIIIAKPLLNMTFSEPSIDFESESRKTSEYTEYVYKENILHTFSSSMQDKVAEILRQNGVEVTDCFVEAEMENNDVSISHIYISADKSSEYIYAVLKKELEIGNGIITVTTKAG